MKWRLQNKLPVFTYVKRKEGNNISFYVHKRLMGHMTHLRSSSLKAINKNMHNYNNPSNFVHIFLYCLINTPLLEISTRKKPKLNRILDEIENKHTSFISKLLEDMV